MHTAAKNEMAQPALAAERDYSLKVLPRAVARRLRGLARGHLDEGRQAIMIVFGFISTVAGFVAGYLGLVSKLASPRGDRGVRGRMGPRFGAGRG